VIQTYKAKWSSAPLKYHRPGQKKLKQSNFDENRSFGHFIWQFISSYEKVEGRKCPPLRSADDMKGLFAFSMILEIFSRWAVKVPSVGVEDIHQSSA
jgi:hypothetical protein